MALNEAKTSTLMLQHATTMQHNSTFLFVPCDGVTGISGGPRKALNRHVQYSCRQMQVAQLLTAAPVPRQIKFRAATLNGECTFRSKRDRKQQMGQPSPLDLTLHLYDWESPAEGLLYDYYAKVVAHHTFCDNTSYFWQTYILQCCHESPVIKQPLIALSCAFRQMDAGARPVNSTNRFSANPTTALSKAVGMLRAYIKSNESPSYAVVLTCAIRLYAHAKVLGDHGTASPHLERAINIFDTWATSLIADEKPAEFGAIRSVLLLLDLSATIEDKARLPTMTQIGPQLTRFDNVEDVTHGYSIVCQAMMIFAICNYKQILAGYASCPAETVQEKLRVANGLAEWKIAADRFVERRTSAGNPLSPWEKDCISSVMLRWLSGKCQFDEVLPSDTPSTSSWDRYAREWLEHGDRMLRSRREPAKGGTITGKRRSLIITYAQCMLMFAGATKLDRARAVAVAMATEVGEYDQLILPIDLTHIGEGRGHSDALQEMERNQVVWTSDRPYHNAGCYEALT